MQEIFKQIKDYIQETEPTKETLFFSFQEYKEVLERMFNTKILEERENKVEIIFFSAIYEDLERLGKIMKDQELLDKDETPEFLKELKKLCQ